MKLTLTTDLGETVAEWDHAGTVMLAGEAPDLMAAVERAEHIECNTRS